jgi:hypothetical protein
MSNQVIGIILFMVGCFLVYFRKELARSSMEDQNALWGFNFAEREIKGSEIIACVIGIGLAIIGILGFFEIIHFNR